MAKRKNTRGRISLADAVSLASRLSHLQANHVQGRLILAQFLIAPLFYALAARPVNCNCRPVLRPRRP